MRNVLLTVTISVIVIAILGSVGCRVLNVLQPGTVADGVQFSVTVETQIDNTGDFAPGYGMLAIMLPSNWTVDGGTYDAPPPFPDGTIANYPAGVAMAVATYDSTHPVPGGYKWVVMRTSGTGDLDGGGGSYDVDFFVNITPHAARTGTDYWISYAVGGVEQADPATYYFGLESEQSWENPIVLGTAGLDTVSVGEIKVKFH